MNAGPFRSAGGTGPAGATGASGPVVGNWPPVVEELWQAWLRTPEARSYSGEWVLLSASARPLDSDLSPTALANRHTPANGQVIVFVEPQQGRYMA